MRGWIVEDEPHSRQRLSVMTYVWKAAAGLMRRREGAWPGWRFHARRILRRYCRRAVAADAGGGIGSTYRQIGFDRVLPDRHQ